MQLNTALVMTRRLQLSSGLPMCWLLHCDLLLDIAMLFCFFQRGHTKTGVVNLQMLTHSCVALWQWLILGPAASGIPQMMY